MMIGLMCVEDHMDAFKGSHAPSFEPGGTRIDDDRESLANVNIILFIKSCRGDRLVLVHVSAKRARL